MAAFEAVIAATNKLPPLGRRTLFATCLQIETANMPADHRAYLLAIAGGKSHEEARVIGDAAMQLEIIGAFSAAHLDEAAVAEFGNRLNTWIREQQKAEPGRFNNWAVMVAQALSLNLSLDDAIEVIGKRRANIPPRLRESFRLAMADYVKSMVATPVPAPKVPA